MSASKPLVADSEPHAAIEADLNAVEELEIDATPTVVVKGLRLARTPDEAKLRQLIDRALAQNGES